MCAGRDPVVVARQAIEGGARLLQLRDKVNAKEDMVRLAKSLAQVCSEADVPFIMNDYLDIALAVRADGIHVGQKDARADAVRHSVGPDKIVGVSTNNPDEARQAEEDGADYVSVGRLYETGSKSDTRPATIDTIRAVKAAVSVPICAIGGINESNIDEVLAAGAEMAAVISAVCGSLDPREAARMLAARFG
jgi:thiamine-phosphate pyrophosphorylase